MNLYAESYRSLTIRELEGMKPYLTVLGATERLAAVGWLLDDPEKRLVHPRAQRVRKRDRKEML